jgi:hypothetical protein
VSSLVARPVQHEQERHDADGHALASHFVGSGQNICTYEKGKLESFEKSSHKSKKGKKRPGTKATVWAPKKVCFEKHCNLCEKHGGAYTTHNTHDCCRFEKDRNEKSNFCAAKKGGLEKALKKSGKKGKKRHYEDRNSNSE